MSGILIIDDVSDTADSIARLLVKAGYDPSTAYSEKEAQILLSQRSFDIIVTDMWMEKPDSGLEILKLAKQLTPHVKVLILTAYGDVRSAVNAMKLGAYDYVEKTPVNDGERDIFDIVTELVIHCMKVQQSNAMHEAVFKDHVEDIYITEIEYYRKEKNNYEIFVDDEHKQVYVKGFQVELQDLPYKILLYLIGNGSVRRSPLRLYADVWNDPCTWTIADRNPKILQDRVKARIYDLRNKLKSSNIKIDYANKRYGLSVPDMSNYCLIREKI